MLFQLRRGSSKDVYLLPFCLTITLMTWFAIWRTYISIILNWLRNLSLSCFIKMMTLPELPARYQLSEKIILSSLPRGLILHFGEVRESHRISKFYALNIWWYFSIHLAYERPIHLMQFRLHRELLTILNFLRSVGCQYIPAALKQFRANSLIQLLSNVQL